MAEQFPRLFSLAAAKDCVISELGVWVGEEWHWRWHWRRDLLPWEENLVDDLAGLVARAQLCRYTVDGWSWKQEASGSYSVKSAYCSITSLTAGESDRFLDTLWNKVVPNKVAALAWRVWRDRLPIRSNLMARGV